MSNISKEVQKNLDKYIKDKQIEKIMNGIMEDILLYRPKNPVKKIITYLIDKYPDSTNGVVIGPPGLPNKYLLESKLSNNESVQKIAGQTNPIQLKTIADTEVISNNLKLNPIFRDLDKSIFDILVAGINVVTFHKNDIIIKQSSSPDNFYYVLTGECIAEQLLSDGTINYLRTLSAGDIFGELGLINDSIRSCSVKAGTEVVVYSVERKLFQVLLKDALTFRRNYFKQKISFFSIFSSLRDYEISLMCDACKVMKYKTGDIILRKNSKCDLYLILEGTVIEQSIENETDPKTHVKFDIIAFTYVNNNTTSPFTYVAKTPVQCIVIDCSAYNKLIRNFI